MGPILCLRIHNAPGRIVFFSFGMILTIQKRLIETVRMPYTPIRKRMEGHEASPEWMEIRFIEMNNQRFTDIL
jgi:hypothetical protein